MRIEIKQIIKFFVKKDKELDYIEIVIPPFITFIAGLLTIIILRLIQT